EAKKRFKKTKCEPLSPDIEQAKQTADILLRGEEVEYWCYTNLIEIWRLVKQKYDIDENTLKLIMNDNAEVTLRKLPQKQKK
ncbi:MAG: hypothetical protein AAB870_02465, partial [Patescibacteria group bacterium]